MKTSASTDAAPPLFADESSKAAIVAVREIAHHRPTLLGSVHGHLPECFAVLHDDGLGHFQVGSLAELLDDRRTEILKSGALIIC